MHSIHKHIINMGGITRVDVPEGAKILDVQVQKGVPVLWALVDLDAPSEERTFQVFGTGFEMYNDPGDHLGTFQMSGGGLVWHLFERKG